MTAFVEITEAAKLLNCTERHIRRQCNAGKLAGAKKEKGKWLIPASAHTNLLIPKSAVTGDLTHLPAAKRADAIKKLGIITDCEKFASDFVRLGGDRTDAVTIYAKKHNIGRGTLYRWLDKYKCQGVIGLVDSRGRGSIEPALSKEAGDVFSDIFLDQKQPTTKQCYQLLVYMNNSQDRNWQIPSLRSIYRWIDDNIPLPVQILHRQGPEAYQALCCPYIQKDPESFSPGECWVGDHHQFDFWIWHRNRWVRPWLTAWMDMRSRAIVGWYLSASPNQTTVMLAMRNGIEVFGPPDSVKIDNGKDYDSQMFTGQTKVKRRRTIKKGYLDETMVAGLYAMMDIRVSFSIPYHPQSKPIERLFGTVESQFGKTIPTYSGNCPQNRPADHDKLLKTQKVIDQAYTFETLAGVFAQYVDVYNNAVHSGDGMDGRSPNSVMATRLNRRVIEANVLDMLMCVWSGKLKVSKNGVRFKSMLYGQFEPRLLEKFGKEVRVAFNPADIRTVTVYSANLQQRICVAEQNQLIKYGDPIAEESMREATRKKASITKAHKNWVQSRHLHYMDLTDLTLKALADANEQNTTDENRQRPNVRPVKTPLDRHVGSHIAEQKMRLVKKAAGAENTTQVLDIDFSILKKTKNKIADIKLFDE